MLRTNSFNAGVAGSAITTGNSGGGNGDAFTRVSGTPIYKAAPGTRAPLAGQLVDGHTLVWNDVTLAGREIWVREYILFDELPSAEDWFFELNVRVGNSVTEVGRLTINANGRIAYRESLGHPILCSVPAAVLAGEWARIELRVLIGTSASNGAVNLWVYRSVEDATTTLQASATAVNTGTTLPNEVGFVYLPGYVLLRDDVAVSDEGKIGPAYPANPVVVVESAAAADQARPVSARKRRLLGQPMSSESAAAVRAVKGRSPGQVVQAETALPITARKVHVLGAAHDQAGAGRVAPAHRRLVVQAVEADQAFAVSNGTFITTAVAGDLAMPISARKVGRLGLALDASMAAPVRPARALLVGLAVEVGAAWPLARLKVRQVGQSRETGTAWSLAIPGRDITGVDPLPRRWSAAAAGRDWSVDPPRRGWSASPDA